MIGYIANALNGKYTLKEYLVSVSGWNRGYETSKVDEIEKYLLSEIEKIKVREYNIDVEKRVNEYNDEILYLKKFKTTVESSLKSDCGEYKEFLTDTLSYIDEAINENNRMIEYYKNRYKPYTQDEIDEMRNERIEDKLKELESLRKFSKHLDNLFGGK